MRNFLVMLTVVAWGVSATAIARAEEGDKPSREDRKAKFMEKFDTNKDGKLDDEERAKARAEFAKNRPEGGRRDRPEGGRRGEGRPSREEMIKKFDANGDGQLDDAEKAKLREAFPRRRGGEGRPSREEMLKKFDANGDGQLDDAEKAKLREAFQSRRGGEGRKKPADK